MNQRQVKNWSGTSTYGQGRLEAVLADVGDRDLQEIKGAVLKRLRAHAGGDLRHDDVTLLAIEVR